MPPITTCQQNISISAMYLNSCKKLILNDNNQIYWIAIYFQYKLPTSRPNQGIVYADVYMCWQPALFGTLCHCHGNIKTNTFCIFNEDHTHWWPRQLTSISYASILGKSFMCGRYWSWRSDAILCHWCWSALVQVMAWCLLGTKPWPEPMLTYCQLDP